MVTIAGRALFSASRNALNVLANCFVAAHGLCAKSCASTPAPPPETSVVVPRTRYLAGQGIIEPEYSCLYSNQFVYVCNNVPVSVCVCVWQGPCDTP